jgi:hypothetical protein
MSFLPFALLDFSGSLRLLSADSGLTVERTL